jgi:hypothetical protein
VGFAHRQFAKCWLLPWLINADSASFASFYSWKFLDSLLSKDITLTTNCLLCFTIFLSQQHLGYLDSYDSLLTWFWTTTNSLLGTSWRTPSSNRLIVLEI